jgi:hypothetical protein
MSGYKHATVTLSSAEYQRLHEADLKSRYKKSEQEKGKKAILENQDLQAVIREMEQRQLAFQEYIGALENQICRVEIDSSKEMVDHQNEFMQGIEASQAEMAEALQEAKQGFYEIFENEKVRHSHQVSRLKQRMNALAAEGKEKAEIVQEWLDSATALRSFIESNYDHEFFMPGFMERTDQEILLASENLQTGMFDAALLGLQHTYQDCSCARLEMERLSAQWTLLHQKAIACARELFKDITSNNVIPAIDLHQQELPFQIDLNKWSPDYGTLLRQVKSLLSRLQNKIIRLTINDFEEIINKTISDYRSEFEQIIYESRLAVIHSQIRVNIADIAIDALGRQGFIVQESGFQENDMHNPFMISLTNIEGSQVTIHVDPLPRLSLGNDLVIESLDAVDRTESELRSRSVEITRALSQCGLQVGLLSTSRPALLPLFTEVSKSSETIAHLKAGPNE